MRSGFRTSMMVCGVWLLAACAQTGERAPARAPTSTEAEEAPARPIATSLASDPLDAPAEPHTSHHHEHGTSQSVVYTCPMHPEVEQDGPGECPKCGMKLVPKESSAAESKHEHAH